MEKIFEGWDCNCGLGRSGDGKEQSIVEAEEDVFRLSLNSKRSRKHF